MKREKESRIHRVRRRWRGRKREENREGWDEWEEGVREGAKGGIRREWERIRGNLKK